MEWPIIVSSVHCFGNESALLECVFDDHYQQCDGLQAALVCQGMFIKLYFLRQKPPLNRRLLNKRLGSLLLASTIKAYLD